MSDIRYAALCHRGKVRRINQDNLTVLRQYLPENNEGTPEMISGGTPADGLAFFGVFDGMGGEEKGEAAAFLAASLAARWNWTASADSLLLFCEEANRRICSFADEQGLHSIGTTAAILLAHGETAIVCNIGDSRVYRIRENGITQLSVDHVIPIAGRKKCPLLQCLGIPETEMRIEPEIREDRVRDGDLFLLCSDGLTDMVGEDRMLRTLRTHPDLRNAARELVQAALDAGGTDNITVILIRA